MISYKSNMINLDKSYFQHRKKEKKGEKKEDLISGQTGIGHN